jgi:hypothetical protein
MFLLLLVVVGIPVAVAMIQNECDRRKSRKLRSGPSCPPHQYTHMPSENGDDIQCTKCKFIPKEW